MLPETDVARARRWVERRNERLPERARGQIRYELDVADRFVTVFECRPPWRPDFGPEWTRFPIVRLHYTKARREWAVYWRDRNLKFHRFEGSPGSSVRAIFEEGDPIFEACAIRTLSHVQIAVRDPSVILEMEELRW